MKDSTQVNHNGTLYAAGAIIEVPDRVAATWLANNWVLLLPNVPPVKPKARTPRAKGI